MKIYIDFKQILLLLTPFFIFGLIYFFSYEIKEEAKKYFFYEKEAPLHVQIKENIARRYVILSNNLNNYEILKKFDSNNVNLAKKIFKPINENEEKYKSSGNFILKYTVIGNGKKRAYLNNKLVKIGDKIDGITILDIRNKRVKIKTDEGVKWINILKR